LLAEKYRAEIERVIAKYPPEHKRSAVMPLLYLAQKEYGHIGEAAMAEVGELCGLSPTQVAGIVGFYSLYYAHPGGRRRVQVCTDLPCALRGAEKFCEALCQKLGVKLGGTTQDGEFTVEAVMCLAACDRAPMFQVQDADGLHYHESESADRPMTVEQALGILKSYTGRPHAEVRDQ
jgi:NADH-quinone oxidoreductase subunit E